MTKAKRSDCPYCGRKNVGQTKAGKLYAHIVPGSMHDPCEPTDGYPSVTEEP